MLWDLDHTLVDTRGVSREALRWAIGRLLGREVTALAPIPGRTDWAIVRDSLVLHGLSVAEADAQVPAGFRLLAEGLRDRHDLLVRRGAALPGASQALSTVAALPGVVQSLLTGNIRVNAERKLAAYGLGAAGLDLDAGAYGDDAADRPALVPLARARAAARTGRTFDASTTVLIGDAPGDLEAARVGGARMVAVATGSTTAAALAAGGADVVLADLSDPAAVVAALTGGSTGAGAATAHRVSG